MKRIFTLFFMFAILVAGSSFKFKRHAHVEQFKNDGYLMAVIDGKTFDAREDNKYTAELANKSIENRTLAPNGTPSTRIATTVNFYGSDFKDDDNNTFTESLGFEYTFNEGSQGDVADQKIILNYNNLRYSSIPGETKIKVNKIQWSSDKRYFTLSADFDTKMRSWGGPGQAQQTLRVKGKMEDITVTVPSWIVLKNANQTAEGEER